MRSAASSRLLGIVWCILVIVTPGCGPGSSGDLPVTSEAPDSLVAEWNATALSMGPTIGTMMAQRAVAMLHCSIYDAVAAFDYRYLPFHVTLQAPAGASPRAAAAAAARHVLTRVYLAPEQQTTIQALYDTHMAQIADGPAKVDGVSFGEAVAAAIMALRSTDGAMAAMSLPHPDGTLPGEWRRTGTGEPMAPGWGDVAPWAMTAGAQFDQGPPPALSSLQYAVEYQEVLELGGAASTVRTAEQSALARFWDPHVPAKWHGLARTIATAEGLSLARSARLFGLLSVTMADAAIATWSMKYGYNLWRPVTAIHEAAGDGNDATIADAGWTPFLMTPPFPEYVSGHSLTSAAAAELLGRYLGSDLYGFQLTTMGIPEPRTYTSFSQAAHEAGMSRIYGGIHFASANLQGQQAGRELAAYVHANFFASLVP